MAGRARRGSVLIIVLWVSFGLVSLAIYFANSMSLEMRAADNQVASLEAEQAIEGAVRYVTNLLGNANSLAPGTMPDPHNFLCEAGQIGEGTFWLIGRTTNELQTLSGQAYFGLVDESSKLNLNTATLEMLEALPNMPPDVAASIIAWRSSSETNSAGGAESQVYLSLPYGYSCKHAPFETVEELRLIYGMNLELLYGEDSNLNGILDANENDGDLLPPYDNRDGRLEPGLFDYVTVYSREPNTTTNGAARINVSNLSATSTNLEQLATLLQQDAGIDDTRINEIFSSLGISRGGGRGGAGGAGGGGGRGGGNTGAGAGAGAGGTQVKSVLEFYVRSKMTEQEFGAIANSITVTNGSYISGLINVNTASQAVLSCVPGIGSNTAPSLVSYRQSNAGNSASIAWITNVLDPTNAIQAGPYLTASAYQFTADIGAVGHQGRGFRRVKFVVDTSGGTPRILYRRDLMHLGWALGAQGRQDLLLARRTR